MSNPVTARFRALQALRLALVVSARNFVPFALFGLALYGPPVAVILAISGDETPAVILDPHAPEIPLAMLAISALAMPLVVYRVLQSLGGVRVSMWQSAKRGLRGSLPALMIAALGLGLDYLHFAGMLIGVVVLPFLFVATPAAIAERRWPLTALYRSAQLTADPWLRIVALRALIGIGNLAILLFMEPLWRYDLPGHELQLALQTAILLTFAVAWQLFTRILETVTYVLLREAKEGLSSEQLTRVFE